MAKYVDGYVLPVPKKNLQAYRRIAPKAGKIWREHGALEYRECSGEDLSVKWASHFFDSSKSRLVKRSFLHGSFSSRGPTGIG
jgi:uncharacterized protein YbaA (DUF1428 family)